MKSGGKKAREVVENCNLSDFCCLKCVQFSVRLYEDIPKMPVQLLQLDMSSSIGPDNFKCNSNICKSCRVTCFLGKVHVWHPREEGALLMITSLAGGFEGHLPPSLKHHFEEKGYLLVSYGFQDFCDECVVASDFLSIKPLRILRFTSHQP